MSNNMALANGVASAHELLDAQAHVWNHIFNFINSMSLKTAIKLGIPDIIHKHGKPMTLSELMNALPVINEAKSQGLYRLMRILIHSKFFIKAKISDEGEGYWLTPASRLLLSNEPLSVAPFVLAMLDPLLTDPWHRIDEWFQNDEYLTPYANHHKKEIWEHAFQEPRLNNFFNEAMASDARLVSSILISDCKELFVGLESIVDVGGGTGTVARAIADAHPGLKCVVLELPHGVADLKGNERLTFVAGDMFEFIPPANAVFLKWILHDWSDEECVKILEKCKEAIPSGGKVIIVDMVVDDQTGNHEAHETQLFFDMLMMALVTGKERTEKEWAKIFFDSGFSSYKITHVLGLRYLIEVCP